MLKINSRLITTIKHWFDNECKREPQMYRKAMGDYNKSPTAVNRNRVFSSKNDFKYYCRKMKYDYDNSRCKQMHELRLKKPREFRRIFKNLTSNQTSQTISIDEFKTHFENVASSSDISVDQECKECLNNFALQLKS